MLSIVLERKKGNGHTFRQQVTHYIATFPSEIWFWRDWLDINERKYMNT